MFLQNRLFKKINYNIKHANKVNKFYTTITRKLMKQCIFGQKRVMIRHKEMLSLVNTGLITSTEYISWKQSQQLI